MRLKIGRKAWRVVLLSASILSAPSAGAVAAPPAQTTPASPDNPPLAFAYVTADYPVPDSLSLVEKTAADAGEAGARLALDEIAVAGRFLHRSYAMTTVRLAVGKPVSAQLQPMLATTKLIVANLEPTDLLALADLPGAKDALILDMRTRDDALRNENCRRNVFHLLPSTAMRADALGQYLVAKRWTRWFVLEGTTREDKAFAADVARTARRFGAKIVETRSYAYDAGSRRVDTGYQQIQAQMPIATRNAPAYDALVVADRGDAFGDYLPYATTDPRPVVGTQGLVATAWSPAFQDYSALQMQHRFQVAFQRPMGETDYGGWLAVRAIGEAATRSGENAAPGLADFLRSPRFEVAGFKGQGLSFRPWDQQLRQPVLLSTALMVVSISPQQAFLHPKFLTDTLGFDEPESRCHYAG